MSISTGLYPKLDLLTANKLLTYLLKKKKTDYMQQSPLWVDDSCSDTQEMPSPLQNLKVLYSDVSLLLPPTSSPCYIGNQPTYIYI